MRTGSLRTGYGGLELAVTAVLDAEAARYAPPRPARRRRRPGCPVAPAAQSRGYHRPDRALRLLIKAAAIPGAADVTGTRSRAAG